MPSMTAKIPHIALISSTLDMTFLKTALENTGQPLRISIYPDEAFHHADVAVAWNAPHGVFSQMPNLKLVHSIAAGLDNILSDPNLPDVPICRVVDKRHALGMAEYALWSTLLFQRDMDRFMRNAEDRKWERLPQVAASDYTVGILGFGAIGKAVGQRLQLLDYKVRGWARSPKSEAGIAMYTGKEQLGTFLNGCNALICLLPLTAETRNILNADLFAQLPQDAALINMGRGEHLVEADLLSALETGQLRGAVLDVFHKEPLPETSPLWNHPKVFVTPHIASVPNSDDVAAQICENASRILNGAPLLNEGNRASGY